MTDRYESPEVKIALTKEEIHKRYQDAALVIFKEQQSKKEVVNYLTFGSSRRTMEYSSYGNQPVIVRRPTGTLASRNSETVSSQILSKPTLKLSKQLFQFALEGIKLIRRR